MSEMDANISKYKVGDFVYHSALLKYGLILKVYSIEEALFFDYRFYDIIGMRSYDVYAHSLVDAEEVECHG